MSAINEGTVRRANQALIRGRSSSGATSNSPTKAKIADIRKAMAAAVKKTFRRGDR